MNKVAVIIEIILTQSGCLMSLKWTGQGKNGVPCLTMLQNMSKLVILRLDLHDTKHSADNVHFVLNADRVGFVKC